MTEKNDSTNSPPKKRNNRRRRPNKKRRNNNANKPQDVKASSTNNESAKKTGSSKKKRSNSKKVLKGHEIVAKYNNLQELHIQARKKYFELVFRKDKKRVAKLSSNYFRTALDIKAFEDRLKPWQTEILETTKTESYPLDLDYSESSGETIETDLPTAPFHDYHFNETQVARPSYSNDTEASTGTMDDYENYKQESA